MRSIVFHNKAVPWNRNNPWGCSPLAVMHSLSFLPDPEMSYQATLWAGLPPHACTFSPTTGLPLLQPETAECQPVFKVNLGSLGLVICHLPNVPIGDFFGVAHHSPSLWLLKWGEWLSLACWSRRSWSLYSKILLANPQEVNFGSGPSNTRTCREDFAKPKVTTSQTRTCHLTEDLPDMCHLGEDFSNMHHLKVGLALNLARLLVFWWHF